MSNAIKCDRCGRFSDSSFTSCLNRGDINFSDSFRKGWYPDKVDLCQYCTTELKDFIRNWCKKNREKEINNANT